MPLLYGLPGSTLFHWRPRQGTELVLVRSHGSDQMSALCVRRQVPVSHGSGLPCPPPPPSGAAACQDGSSHLGESQKLSACPHALLPTPERKKKLHGSAKNTAYVVRRPTTYCTRPQRHHIAATKHKP